MGVNDWDPTRVNVPRKIDIEAEREKKNIEAYARAEWLRLERQAKHAKPNNDLYNLLEKTVTKPKTEAPEPEQEKTDTALRRLSEQLTTPRQDWESGLLEALEKKRYKDR